MTDRTDLTTSAPTAAGLAIDDPASRRARDLDAEVVALAARSRDAGRALIEAIEGGLLQLRRPIEDAASACLPPGERIALVRATVELVRESVYGLQAEGEDAALLEAYGETLALLEEVVREAKSACLDARVARVVRDALEVLPGRLEGDPDGAGFAREVARDLPPERYDLDSTEIRERVIALWSVLVAEAITREEEAA